MHSYCRSSSSSACLSCYCRLSLLSDDDPAPRLGYEGIRKKLGIAEEDCMILGAKYEEVKTLVQTVMSTAKQHGHENVICIFDQDTHQSLNLT